MKLLFLNTNIGYGGASKMIVWLANQCANAGHDVTFLTYRENAVYQSVDSRIHLVHKQLEDINGRGNILDTVKWLHHFIKRNLFDIGVAFLSPSMLRMAIAAKGTKMKIIFSQRGDPYFIETSKNLKSWLIDCINTWAFNQANGYVFQTKQAQEYYRFCPNNVPMFLRPYDQDDRE